MKPFKVIKERLKEIESLPLSSGAHESFENGACVMEVVSYVAGEPWSDHPKCACPILTEYALRINDCFNDEHRQLLKPLIPDLVGTRSTDEVQIARKRFIRWRNVTVTYPMILEAVELPEIASKLRGFKNNLESMAEAYKYLQKKKKEILDNAYASAYAYAYAKAKAHDNAKAYAASYIYAAAYTHDNDYTYAATHTYGNAYANTAAYTRAYDNVLRAKIAEAAVETLRLAIQVKGEGVNE